MEDIHGLIAVLCLIIFILSVVLYDKYKEAKYWEFNARRYQTMWDRLVWDFTWKSGIEEFKTTEDDKDKFFEKNKK